MEIEQDLLQAFQNLTETQKNLLERIIGSFQAGVKVSVDPNSDLCATPEFSEYFANLFSVYHSITEHKFEKKSFEFAFKCACITSGFTSEINRNSSHQGEDITRGGEKISLKTEGEKSDTTFKISKFSESRFIPNYKTEMKEKEINALPKGSEEKESQFQELLRERSEELLPNLVADFQDVVRHHIANYDRIIALKTKAIEKDGEITSYKYRLIEIPLDLIRKSLNLSSEDFKPLKGNGGTSASVTINGEKVYRITLDGSVEKISFTGIKISECITHAEFLVPVSI